MELDRCSGLLIEIGLTALGMSLLLALSANGFIRLLYDTEGDPLPPLVFDACVC